MCCYVENIIPGPYGKSNGLIFYEEMADPAGQSSPPAITYRIIYFDDETYFRQIPVHRFDHSYPA